MTLKEVGRVVEELGSETTTEFLAVCFCFLIMGGGVSARSFPFAFESRVGLSESGWDFALAAKTLLLKDFGDSTRAFFFRLGFVGKEEALDVRADMMERVRVRVLKIFPNRKWRLFVAVRIRGFWTTDVNNARRR